MTTTPFSIDAFMGQLPRPMARVHSAEIALCEPFIDIVGRFAHEPGTIALLRGYQASAENCGSSRFVATTRQSAFVIDTQGNGAHPVDTLLASLCSCIGHYVREHFVTKDSPVPAFRVSAESDTPVGASSLKAISVRVDLGRRQLDSREQAEIMAEVERCKIYGTLRQACPIHVTLVTGGAQAGAA
jgi:uncharacterized OsmC-like protein